MQWLQALRPAKSHRTFDTAQKLETRHLAMVAFKWPSPTSLRKPQHPAAQKSYVEVMIGHREPLNELDRNMAVFGSLREYAGPSLEIRACHAASFLEDSGQLRKTVTT